MKDYIGVDLGKRKAVVVKKDRHEKITGKATLAVTEAALAKYFAKQDSRSEVVVEKDSVDHLCDAQEQSSVSGPQSSADNIGQSVEQEDQRSFRSSCWGHDPGVSGRSKCLIRRPESNFIMCRRARMSN
jgi:hypothetical protein